MWITFNSFAGFHAFKIAGSHPNSMSNEVSYVWWRGLDSARGIGWSVALHTAYTTFRRTAFAGVGGFDRHLGLARGTAT